MMTVMPVAEAASITYGAIVMYTINPWLSLATLVGGPVLVIVALRVGRPLQRRSVARQQSIAQAAATAADVVQGLRILKGLGAIITVRGRYDEESGTAYARTVEANAAEARLNGVTDATGAIFVSSLGIAAGVLALHGGRDDRSAHHGRGPDPVLDHPDDDARPEPRVAMGLGGSIWTADPRSPRCRLRAQRRGGLGADQPLHRRAAHRPHRRPRRRTTSWSTRLESLPRTRVIVAPHAADLFDGSVADNVYPDPAVAERALRVASCDDIPEGSHKRVGEGGRMLSGGQRQRVSLARAVAFDPEVLVLQDPTTAVDSVTEQNIADRLSRQRADKITLVFSEAPAWHAVAAHHLSVADLLARTDELTGGTSGEWDDHRRHPAGQAARGVAVPRWPPRGRSGARWRVSWARFPARGGGSCWRWCCSAWARTPPCWCLS